MVIRIGQHSSPRVRLHLHDSEEQPYDLSGAGLIQLVVDDVALYAYPGAITVLGPPENGLVEIQFTATHTDQSRRFRVDVTKGSVVSTPAYGVLAIDR